MNKEKAMDHLSFIQEVFRKEESKPLVMSHLIRVIAWSNIAYVISNLLLIQMMGRTDGWTRVPFVIKVFTFLFICYAAFRVIRTERKAENNYYRFTLAFILLTTVLMPFIMFATRMFSFWFSDSSMLNQMMYEMSKMNSFLQVSMFSGLLLILGSFRKNRWYLLFSILNLFVYLILSFKTIDIPGTSTFILLGEGYRSIVMTIGYLYIGNALGKTKAI